VVLFLEVLTVLTVNVTAIRTSLNWYQCCTWICCLHLQGIFTSSNRSHYLYFTSLYTVNRLSFFRYIYLHMLNVFKCLEWSHSNFWALMKTIVLYCLETFCLQTEWLKVHSLSPGRVKIFTSPYQPDWLWGPVSLLSNGYCGIFPQGQRSRGLKLTTHLHQVLRSRELGSMQPFPIRLHGTVLS
jgi:hypothetical protein